MASFSLACLISFGTMLLFNPTLHAQAIDLNPKSMTEISFDDIPKTSYSYRQGEIHADVKASSSALIQPFAEVRTIKQVDFMWRIKGSVKTTDAAHEETKAGDDYPLRIGLCEHGEGPFVPFFAPAWIKKIRNIMKQPCAGLLYLVVGSKHKIGATWQSPYSDSMIFRAIEGTKQDDWETVNYSLSKPAKVVGLWIMSDGDNTNSRFEVILKDLRLDGHTDREPETKKSAP